MCGLPVVLALNEPIKPAEIKILDASGKDITGYCEFSWSFDGVCYTPYSIYASFTAATSGAGSDFWLKIKVKAVFNGGLFINGNRVTCYRQSLYSGNIFCDNICSETISSIYSNLSCALLMQKQLSDSIICMFGIPCYYFRTVSDAGDFDYNFKEYVLHHVDSVKHIHLMLNEGQLPSSKPKLSDFDFEYDLDWDVEVGKTEFATAFGDTAYPVQRDLVYVPMLKRMYTVNSAYDEKQEGLLWHSTTFKLALVKYQDNTAVDTGSIEGILDSVLANRYEDVFGEGEQRERHATGVDDVEPVSYGANTLYSLADQDAVRASMSKNIHIAVQQFNQGAVICGKNCYTGEGEVTYLAGVCNTDLTVSLFFKTDSTEFSPAQPIFSLGGLTLSVWSTKDSQGQLSWQCGQESGLSLSYEPGSWYCMVIRASRTGNISALTLARYVSKRPEVPVYSQRLEWQNFDFASSSSVSFGYKSDFTNSGCQKAKTILSPGVSIANIKVFAKYISDDDIKECVKYTTDERDCIINDLCRPLISGDGFCVK